MRDDRPEPAPPVLARAPAGDDRVVPRMAELDALSQALVHTALGDRAAFRILFEALAPAIKGMAMRQGADPASADEIVQDTFLAVWRKAGLYAPERGSASAWVYAIARNVRIDRLRRQPAWQALTDDADERPSDDAPADEVMASRQIQSRLRAVMAQLPPDQAAVVRLAFIDGLSHAEIAAATGAPLGTVKTRMNLAYQKMRAAMQDFR